MPEDRDEKDSADEADEADTEEQEDAESEDAESEQDGGGASASDDDADDSSDDEDEAPSPPKKKKTSSSSSSSRRAGAPQRKRRTAPVKPVLPPEKDIAAPSRQTLILLGVMAFATLAMWGSARFACNAHPAQTRKPREVTTAELSRDPKDAALELQQRWNSYDFKGALELAKGSIADELKKAQADCEKDKAGCDAKQKALDGKVLATAALLSRGMGTAKVRVISRGGAEGEKTVVYALDQEGSAWKVSGRTDAPAPAPSPAPAPAPSGSAAP